MAEKLKESLGQWLQPLGAIIAFILSWLLASLTMQSATTEKVASLKEAGDKVEASMNKALDKLKRVS